MAFLTLNGIEIQVSASAGATIERVKQGEYGRTATFTARSYANALSEGRKATTRLYENAEAAVLRQVIRGDGHVWSFDSTLFSSRGQGIDSGPSLGELGFNPGLYGNAVTVGAGGDPLVYLNTYTAWTLSGWAYDIGGDATWHLYTFTSAGGFWIDGVATAPLGVPISTGPGYFLLSGSSDGAAFDDVALLPYVVPATWPLWHASLGRALPPLRYTLAEGDWYGTALEVLGEVNNGRTEQWTDNSTLKTGEAFEFILHDRSPR